MANLNLPIDIPWKLVNSSEDMMDKTFCDKSVPTPFRSSIALYCYNPSESEIPTEFTSCGQNLTFLKVSCSITGYQPTTKERQGIVDLLNVMGSVDYSKIEEIIAEYLACYGALLNVSVHYKEPEGKEPKQYPRIIDFEPKIREFVQAASETGELLTSSNNNLKTGKSYVSTETTKNSWKINANTKAKVPLEDKGEFEVGLGGETGQERTESDQDGWSINTDATTLRQEKESTTTQLSQMYNLLTGYHAGTNRVSFVLLPRPHSLQPTNRRTFVQGFREIEGMQDFFLIVLKERRQSLLCVDINLQTGHFPEDITIPSPSSDSVYEYPIQNPVYPVKFTLTAEKHFLGGPTKKEDKISELDVVDEANSWEADPTRGDPGRGGVSEKIVVGTVDVPEVDFDRNELIRIHQHTVSREEGDISNEDYKISNGILIVRAHLEASSDMFWDAKMTTFNRVYEVFLRRRKVNSPISVADVSRILITQRKLCTEISNIENCLVGNDTTSSKDSTVTSLDESFIVDEPTLNLGNLHLIPEIGSELKTGKAGYVGDARKKAILRKINATMISSSSSSYYTLGGKNGINYIQSKHFLTRLCQILTAEVLSTSILKLHFINSEVSSLIGEITLKELLVMSDLEFQSRFKVHKQNLKIFNFS